MNRTITQAPTVTVDVYVFLTAVVRPEPEAGGYSASIPAARLSHTGRIAR